MSAIVVTVDFQIKPEATDRWLELALEHLQTCVAEQGMLRFWVQRDTHDPAHFLFYEEWASREDLEASMDASWRSAYVSDTERLWETPRAMTVYERVQTPWEPLDAAGVPIAWRSTHARATDRAIIVTAEFRIHADRAERWLELMQHTHGPIGAAEHGMLRYWIHRDADDPSHFLLYEEWADRADFEASMRAAWWRDPYLADTEPLWAAPRCIRTFRRVQAPWEPLDATGLPVALTLSRAVRFDRYGGIDVLDVVGVPSPRPGPDDVLVAVRAAGINPGEAAIREGRMHDQWPATFPSGQGSDLAGVVLAVGSEVSGFAIGDEVLGFTDDRASHAERVVVPQAQLTLKPPEVSWEQAGSLKVAGTTAYASVRAVDVREGDVVVVSGAAGGVGSLTVQLARLRGATVIGLAGPAHHDWLAGRGAVPIDYHDPDVADRIRAVHGSVDAFVDTYGNGYVALAAALEVAPARINTTIDFAAAERHGAQAVGESEASTPEVLAELAALIAGGQLEVAIARVYPLEDVREAYRELEQRHTHGKITLVP